MEPRKSRTALSLHPATRSERLITPKNRLTLSRILNGTSQHSQLIIQAGHEKILAWVHPKDFTIVDPKGREPNSKKPLAFEKKKLLRRIALLGTIENIAPPGNHHAYTPFSETDAAEKAAFVAKLYKVNPAAFSQFIDIDEYTKTYRNLEERSRKQKEKMEE